MSKIHNVQSRKLFFSIIIPVRGFNDYLKKNISHLKKLEGSNFEVIIVIDNAEDVDFNDDVRFKVISSGSVSPGEKRNLGVLHAKGEILAFLDDDAYPTSNWLTEAEIVFLDNDVYALGGPALTPKDSCFLEKMAGRVLESFLASGKYVYRYLPKTRKYVDDYPTVNLFIKADAFKKVGGFSPEFWPGEDTKLCLDLVKCFGQKFLYDPGPIVFHHRRRLFIPHLKQISRYGGYRGQFAKIFPQTSRLPAYFIPSLFVLGVCFGWIGGFFFKDLWSVYFGVLLLYTLFLFLYSVITAVRDKCFREVFYLSVGIFLTHVFYGINFLLGLLKRPKFMLRLVDSKTGNYIDE